MYSNPLKFATDYNTTVDQAVIWCKHYNNLHEETDKARICPSCGKPTLEYESGDYELGTSDAIHCENADDDCEFVSGVTEQLEPLVTGYDFDIIVALWSDYSKDPIQFEEDHDKSWADFVTQEVNKLLDGVGA